MTDIEALNAKNTRLIAAATILAALISKHNGVPGYHEGPKPKQIAAEAVKLFVELEDALIGHERGHGYQDDLNE